MKLTHHTPTDVYGMILKLMVIFGKPAHKLMESCTYEINLFDYYNLSQINVEKSCYWALYGAPFKSLEWNGWLWWPKIDKNWKVDLWIIFGGWGNKWKGQLLLGVILSYLLTVHFIYLWISSNLLRLT